jgi:GMP synthase (glutamine-hydrolysing)
MGRLPGPGDGVRDTTVSPQIVITVKALIFTHHPDEGPGLLKDILRERGWKVKEVGLWKGEVIPEPGPFHLLILMGGPMSVNDEDLHPFLLNEKAFVRRWVGKGNPTIGVCLGAQLIADCLGARVYKGDHEELGWYELTVTAEGKNDQHIRGFPSRFPVFQWHGETFDLPKGAILLATASDYPHQAFRFADLTYAFQFHLEVTEAMLHTWLSENGLGVDKRGEINADQNLHLPVIHKLCRSFMLPFLETIEQQTGARGARVSLKQEQS